MSHDLPAVTVAALLVNWNGGPMAAECARSLSGQTLRPSLHVVDNASTDTSVDLILAAFPDAQIIRNRENRGYAAANNQALAAAAEADYVLLINNDAVLPDPDSLEEAVRFAEARPEVRGMCGRYEYPSGEFQPFYNQLPGPLDLATVFGFGRRLGWLRGRPGLRRFHLADRDFDRPGTIEQPAFACVLARGWCLREVGPMDERFPIFFNDVDYCQRWQGRGWTWHYLPGWRVVHHHGASVKRFRHCAPELLSSAVRFAGLRYGLAGRLLVTASATAEAAWMRLARGDRHYRVGHIALGRTFFEG